MHCRERARDYLIPAPTFKSPEIIYPLHTRCCVKNIRYYDVTVLTVRWHRHRMMFSDVPTVWFWWRRSVIGILCLTAHAAHISHYINPWCFPVHGKICVLCSKVSLHFSFTLHCPSFFSPDLFSFSLSLFKYVQCYWVFRISWRCIYLVNRPGGHSSPKQREEIMCAFCSSGGNSYITFTLGLREIEEKDCGLA